MSTETGAKGYHPSSITPVQSILPPMAHQSRCRTPRSHSENEFVRKFTRICAPVCIILSISLAIYFLNSIFFTILVKDGEYYLPGLCVLSTKTYHHLRPIYKGLLITLIVLGAFTLIVFFLAFCKKLAFLLYLYTFYHIISNVTILLGVIAEFILDPDGPFQVSNFVYVALFLAFFFFANYTNWQVWKLVNILKSSSTTITVSYNATGSGYPVTYSLPKEANPPPYPGEPQIPFEAPPKYGNWTVTTNLV